MLPRTKTSFHGLLMGTLLLAQVMIGTSASSSLNSERRLREASCEEASFDIIDEGYHDDYRGWYDPLGCGICNQYCRWVGNSNSGGDPANKLRSQSSFWSCQTGSSRQSEVWTQYDAIGFSFPFHKCSHKNEMRVGNFQKTRNDWLRVSKSDDIVSQIITLGSSDGIYPGQFAIQDLDVTLYVTEGFLDHIGLAGNVDEGRLIWLGKLQDNGSGVPDTQVTLCAYEGGNDLYCNSGTTAVRPDAPPVKTRQNIALSLFEDGSVDPAGDWELSVQGGRAGVITEWTLSFTLVDLQTGNRNRRVLRGAAASERN